MAEQQKLSKGKLTDFKEQLQSGGTDKYFFTFSLPL